MRSMNFNVTDLSQPITEESPVSHQEKYDDEFSSACEAQKKKSVSSPGGEDLIAGCRANMLNNFEVNLTKLPKNGRTSFTEKKTFHIRLNQTEQDKESTAAVVEEEKKERTRNAALSQPHEYEQSNNCFKLMEPGIKQRPSTLSKQGTLDLLSKYYFCAQ